jgi:hypothetical protein
MKTTLVISFPIFIMTSVTFSNFRVSFISTSTQACQKSARKGLVNSRKNSQSAADWRFLDTFVILTLI